MRTLHFVSHTHWDREWHEPFQIFRLKLAQTIDQVLATLASDPDYKYFMLDGQTIVLEDYVEICPEREDELRGYIREGRVLVGPWYILPDEFLVSGEAIIHNLLRGTRIARAWGRCMQIGYIPDPFGHISQMPQILTGFGINVAMFRRGLADEPTEVNWEGADGTRVLATYLRDGYDNAAWLSREPDKFVEGLKRLVDSLAPYAVTEHMLMMNGTDHMQPWPNLSTLLRAAANQMPGTLILHSNLPAYAGAVKQALEAKGRPELCLVKGELRNPKRHHLLPGVASTRMWIKQRNARAQTLLEKWAEPLAAVAMGLDGPTSAIGDLRPELHLAWKYLLQNHPHDSICGCSVDQVHAEMVPRFDWVEQIGGEIVKRSSESLIRTIDTRHEDGRVAVVIFNPAPGPRSDAVSFEVGLPPGVEQYGIVDETGSPIPVSESGRRVREHFNVTATADDLRWMFGAAQSGKVEGLALRAFSFRVEGDQVYLDLTVSDQGEPDHALVQAGLARLAELTADPRITTFHVRVHSPTEVDLVAYVRGLPGSGYKTLWLVPSTAPLQSAPAASGGTTSSAAEPVLENEFLRVEVNPEDGTVSITDKTTGAIFAGANRFSDGGDRGDLYNYCPPEHDQIVDSPDEPATVEWVDKNAVRQSLRVRSSLTVPASLTPDRSARSEETVRLAISTLVTLAAGARRVEFHTQVINSARDHRLRVEFPTPIRANESHAEQAFDLVRRSLQLEPASPDWVEQPVPAKPMQNFVSVSDSRTGLILATRGLPEYEVKPAKDTLSNAPTTGVTVALTLLRCVGWLSRPDLSNRRGDAGPESPTPGAQELGEHSFDYSLIPYGSSSRQMKGWTDGLTALDRPSARAQALAFAAPLRGMSTDAHRGTLPSTASWVDVSHPDFLLTALKPPEEGDGWIVRGYNVGDAAISVELRPLFHFTHVALVNLNEELIRPLPFNAVGKVELQVKPREIITLRFSNQDENT